MGGGYNCPLKAKQPNGYDVIMASGMMGFLLPEKIDASMEAGIDLPIKEYLFTMILADEKSPYSIMNDNCCGDGGIPGYIMGTLVPSEHTLSRMPVILAHETNHNMRFQIEKWRNDISLGEYMVCEGLAENFATFIYGEEQMGPWVSRTDMQTLKYIRQIFIVRS